MISSLFHVFTHLKFFVEKSLGLDFKNGVWTTNFDPMYRVFILKMKETNNVTKHVHLFQANLHQLIVTSVTVFNDETIICFTRSMPPNCRTFISALRRQLHRTLQSLITNLIQKETLMKDMNLHNERINYLCKEEIFKVQ
jgi:hypothetical protein